MKTKLSLLYFFLVLFLGTTLIAQTSGLQYYRSAVMNGNNIKTVFGNWGVIGQPADTRPRGAWLYETNGYIGDESILLGIEFPIKDYNGDSKSDTVHSVITSPVSRPASSFDINPTTSDPWTFLPDSNSLNTKSNSVALSSDISTWPASWKDGNGSAEWNGFFGKGKMVADLEAYFQMNDENDHRFDTPANNSYGKNFTGRNGQGISITVRYLQWNHPAVKDILFRVYDIKNESALKYNKVVFGYLLGTYVGITTTDHSPQEYNDDYTVFFKKENVLVFGDYDNNCSRNPLWKDSVGKCGTAFIDSPNKNEIGSYSYFTPSNQIRLGDDEILWAMMKEGSYSNPSNVLNDTIPLAGSDGDFVFGTYYFSLDSGEVKRIASVLAYGYTNAEVLQKVQAARDIYKNNFSLPNVVYNVLNNISLSFGLQQNFPNPFNPSTIINYQLPITSYVTLKVYDLLGREVATLVNEMKEAGYHTFQFHGADLASGIYFYQLRAGDFLQTKKMVLMK
ncbi:MAG: T9SS type A sorting domain-containing protein [Bacteroidota bacterium]|nr:T9SS type A sorting domain-containing protein [Bacteroidota bacterium]